MSIFHFFRPKPDPLVIHDELGTFTLKRPNQDTDYEGTINWLGAEASVSLEIDSRERLTADTALENLRRIAASAAEWDRKIRQFAAEDMADSDGRIEIWEEDGNGDYSRITKEEFIRRISIGFIHIYADETIFFYYNPDEMFTDHGLGIRAMVSGEILSSEICG